MLLFPRMSNQIILEQIAMLCEFIAKLPANDVHAIESVRLIKILSAQLN